jgi:hypothetical protein
MRFLAYAILLVGFVYICHCQMEIAPMSRAVLDEQIAKLPNQESYSRLDVTSAILSAIRDMGHHVPPFIYGAFIMLGGAIILDWSRRRK